MANGKKVWLSINGIPIFDANGKFQGYRGTGRDVTKETENEFDLEEATKNAENANRAKSEFLATMSHELRTPLASIKGSLGLVSTIMSEGLSDEEKELFEIALRNSDAMLFLVNELLDYEKIVSGGLEIATTPHDICALTAKVVNDNQGYASAQSVIFNIKGADNSLIASVQEHRFEQVLRNLLSNAAKFSDPGSSVDISVSVEDGLVYVTVKDDGPGIPDEFRKVIFEPFSQADSSSTRNKSGTGLGLSISKAFTEAMGGTLGFDSEVGVGSTFWVRFPEV